LEKERENFSKRKQEVEREEAAIVLSLSAA